MVFQLSNLLESWIKAQGQESPLANLFNLGFPNEEKNLEKGVTRNLEEHFPVCGRFLFHTNYLLCSTFSSLR